MCTKADLLEAENRELESKLRNFSELRADHCRMYREMKENVKALRSRVDVLEVKNQDLKSNLRRYTDVSEDYGRIHREGMEVLERRVKELEYENAALKSAAAMLKQENLSLNEVIPQMPKMAYEHIERYVDSLVRRLESVVVENTNLRHELNKVKAERDAYACRGYVGCQKKSGDN